MSNKKPVPERHEWLFRGTLKMSGVIFSVSAETEAEALQKARDGDWDDYDTTRASGDDWKLDDGTMELNE